MTTGEQVADLQDPAVRRTPQQKATAEPITVRLGGADHQLRVLTIAEARSWKRYVGGQLKQLLATDVTDPVALVDGIANSIVGMSDDMLAAVLLYDADHVLPSQDVIEQMATEPEVEEAFLAVCAVAFPFVRRLRVLLAQADLSSVVAAVQEVAAARQRELATPIPSPTPTS